MPLNFPSNPTVGQQSTQNGRVYQWTGTVWQIAAASATITPADIGAAAALHTHSAAQISDFSSAVAAASPEEVVEFLTPADFPATGNSSLLYIATDNARAYRWVGSQYAEVGPTSLFMAGHTHAASDIVSGTLAAARLGSGATATNFLRGDSTFADPVTFATTAQAQDLTATTVATSPANVRTAISATYRISYNTNFTASGGAVGSLNTLVGAQLNSNATANGAAVTYFSTQFSTRGRQSFDFSRPVAFRIVFTRQACPSTGVLRFLFGGLSNAFSWTTLDRRGFGFEVRQSRIWILAHNGTSLTSLDTGIDGPTADFGTDASEVWVRSDGAGNVTLTHSLNGGSISTTTTTGGPSSLMSGENPIAWAGVNNGGTASSANFIFQPHLLVLS